MDNAGISCFTTPDAEQFERIREKALAHLRGGGAENRLPHANQLWMLVGFELFSALGQIWECRETYPQAIGHARALRLHLEEATVYAFEFRPVAQSGPA